MAEQAKAEPTMEEILSSIRKIIADDSGSLSASEPAHVAHNDTGEAASAAPAEPEYLSSEEDPFAFPNERPQDTFTAQPPALETIGEGEEIKSAILEETSFETNAYAPDASPIDAFIQAEHEASQTHTNEPEPFLDAAVSIVEDTEPVSYFEQAPNLSRSPEQGGSDHAERSPPEPVIDTESASHNHASEFDALMQETPPPLVETTYSEPAQTKAEPSPRRSSLLRSVSEEETVKAAFSHQEKPVEETFKASDFTSDNSSQSGETLPIEVASAALGDFLRKVKFGPENGGDMRIDDLVKDIARPLIKDWLDANLASIVEAHVEKEIQRISRSAR